MNRATSKCVALNVNGKRCARRAVCSHPITFVWDLIAGQGTGGPSVTLCRLHDYVWSLEEHERVQVVGGWLGRAWNPKAKCWTVLTTVYELSTGNELSRMWWTFRYYALTLGDRHGRDTTFDDVLQLALCLPRNREEEESALAIDAAVREMSG